MGSIVKSIFSGPPKPDTSALDAAKKRNDEQSAKLAEQEEKKKAEERTQRRAVNAARAGRRGSNLFATATGVEQSGGSTLGGS